METVTGGRQSLDAAGLSPFSADVFLDLNSSREALSLWSGFIAGSIAGKLSCVAFTGHLVSTDEI